MASLKDMAESRASLLNFDPRKIKIKPGLNVRDLSSPDNHAHIEHLASLISLEGVRNPLVVFKEQDDVFVVEGRCRLAAVHLLISQGVDIATVPCIPEPAGQSEFDRIAGQFTSNSGKHLTSAEQAQNIKRMLGYGKSRDEIAKKIGRSVSFISQLLDFQAAPMEVHAAVNAGEISQTEAAKIVKRDGPIRAVETIKKAVETARASGKKKATAKHVDAGVAKRVGNEDAIHIVTVDVSPYNLLLAITRRIANMEEVSAAEAQDLLIKIGEGI